MNSDILIIGAGTIGLTSALALAQDGHRVTVVDRGAVGGESTWAGAGILSPLLPWDYGPVVTRLTERGRQLWPAWIDEIRARSGVDPEYRESGLLVLGLSDPAPARDWCAAHAWPHPPPPPELRPLAGRDPHPLWLPGVAQVRNPRLAQALHLACRHLGVTILSDVPVLALSLDAGKVVGVETGQGLLQAGAYVLAAGAWTNALLGRHAQAVEIFPVRGQILLFKAAPGRLPCIVYREGHYLVPRSDGHILAGSTLERVGYDKGVTAEARAALLAFARQVLPALGERDLVRQWSGLRPGSPGNVPTIARHPELDNLYVNGGHFRYGVTMAPASAEILANLLAGRAQAIDAAPYAWPVTAGR